ncbi:MAG TPA: hypothetical protein VK284_04115 [Streptosporangiaceae bacterium]|nr:hypothetical protein [Streptosporangiaceae bacterium]
MARSVRVLRRRRRVLGGRPAAARRASWAWPGVPGRLLSEADGDRFPSSALNPAVRYDWADRNVAKNASPPHPRKREPEPPSPDQAARLLNLVRAEDEEFGLYLWTAFTTGARRGEVSALRENRFDFAGHQQVRLARNYPVKQG